MDQYEEIDNEIKHFMNTSDKQLPCRTDNQDFYGTTKNNVDDLLSTLSNLLKIYNDIQLMLESKDYDGIKNTLLGNDIKISLVCESLMKVLKDEVSEKKELNVLLDEEKNKNKKINQELEELRIKLSKTESDVEYVSRSNAELSRIIKDQKNMVNSFREKAELERKACDSIKSINKELEMLRIKAMDKCGVYEKEIGVLKERLNEKEALLKELNKEVKELHKNKEALTTRICNYEKTIESYKKKLESRENSLNLCNSELSKLISEEKRKETILEDFKEKASYYERLYKATNKQNEYLNAQLSRMINIENVDKLEVLKEEDNVNKFNETEVTVNSDKSKKYKRKMKKFKNMYNFKQKENKEFKDEINKINQSIEHLRAENKRLQEDKEKAISSNNKMIDTLMNKIEVLLKKNREYQNQIYGGNKKQEVYNDSFRTVNDGEETKVNEDVKILKIDKGDGRNYKDLDFLNNKLKILDMNNSTLFMEDSKYRRPFKLENNYEENVQPESINFDRKTFEENKRIRLPDSFYRSLKKEKEAEDITRTLAPVNNEDDDVKEYKDQYRGLFSYLNGDKEKKQDTKENEYLFEEAENNVDYNKNDIDDTKSVDSIKTIKTTSSLKDMIQKTDVLQKKFSDLEKELDEIKSSDKPKDKKMHDQIKAYTDYYYSDFLDLSNDNDIL